MDREVDRDLICPRTRNLDVETMLEELTFSCAHQTGADKPCACIIWSAGESEDFEFRVRRIGRRGRQRSTSGPAYACHSYTVAMVRLVG
jgi:hypothetical protein